MKSKNPAPRRKPKNYSDSVYGARVTFADARVLDEYARTHRLAHAEVVRLCLHQFALRQQSARVLADTPTPVAATPLAEQLRPLHTRLDELAAGLRELAPHLVRSDAEVSSGTASASPATFSVAQHKLLEQVLVTVSLALRLQVNYLVAPVLDALPADQGTSLAAHVHVAEKGREQWSAATRAVFQRAGKRILQELGSVFLTPPETSTQTPHPQPSED